MEFDKSKVYTALNADELKVGSKVIVADDIASLYNYVKIETCIRTLKGVLPESCKNRFEIIPLNNNESDCWNLAYLISESKSINCSDLKIGDILSDGNLDLMVLGIDRTFKHNVAVYLPYMGWSYDNNLNNFHKKEEQIEKE